MDIRLLRYLVPEEGKGGGGLDSILKHNEGHPLFEFKLLNALSMQLSRRLRHIAVAVYPGLY